MPKQKPLIEFRNIYLKFEEQTVLNGFNFKIYPQDKVVITGPSGIGKSSLFYLLLGLKQPQAGKIFLNGKQVTAKNIQILRSQIAYLDQDVSLGSGTVKEAINEYFSFKINKNCELDQNRLEKLLSELSLNKKILTKSSSQLSGGERQRLGLIIALLLNRPIFLLDEVDSSLDTQLVKDVRSKLLSLTEKTIILITHDLEWRQLDQVKVFNLKDKQWQ